MNDFIPTGHYKNNQNQINLSRSVYKLYNYGSENSLQYSKNIVLRYCGIIEFFCCVLNLCFLNSAILVRFIERERHSGLFQN